MVGPLRDSSFPRLDSELEHNISVSLYQKAIKHTMTDTHTSDEPR